MKAHLQPPITLYLQSPQSPLFLHPPSNSTSPMLSHFRNNAYILNKLSLLNIQHSLHNTITNTNTNNNNNNSSNTHMFNHNYLQLYASALYAILRTQMDVFRNWDNVKGIVHYIENYYRILEKLTYFGDEGKVDGKDAREGKGAEGGKLRRRVSLNQFWPRVRGIFIELEDRIGEHPQFWALKEFVIIRRGLLEPDKGYFVAQMMAKKIQSEQLKNLLKKYQNQSQKSPQHQHQHQKQQQPINIQIQQQQQHQTSQTTDWFQLKKHIRMLPLTDENKDWTLLAKYLELQQFKDKDKDKDNKNLNTNTNKNTKENQYYLDYIKDIVQDYLREKLEIVLGEKRTNKAMKQKFKEGLIRRYKQNSKNQQQLKHNVQLREKVLHFLFLIKK